MVSLDFFEVLKNRSSLSEDGLGRCVLKRELLVELFEYSDLVLIGVDLLLDGLFIFLESEYVHLQLVDVLFLGFVDVVEIGDSLLGSLVG